MTLDLCPSPALYPYYKNDNDTVIVVDVFRASSTMCAMLNNGASSIIPVASIEEAEMYKAKGYLVGAERKTRKCDFADFGNSPFDYTREIVENREVVFTTTNGTMAIEAAKDCKELIIGAFTNIDAVAEHCIKQNGRVVVLAAGWNNKVSIEDTLFAGSLAETLLSKMSKSTDEELQFGSDSIKMIFELWLKVKTNLVEFIEKSDHYKRLIDNGAVGDAEYCITPNSVSVVPVYNKESKKLTLPNQNLQNQSTR